MLFAPDNFRQSPYVAGLNQLGHVVFGAAIAFALSLALPVAAAMAVAFIGIALFERYQLVRLSARKSDYWQDLAFWGVGVAWFNSEWIAVIAVVFGGAWMIATRYANG